jgi:hypothetical protein
MPNSKSNNKLFYPVQYKHTEIFTVILVIVVLGRMAKLDIVDFISTRYLKPV